MRLQFARNNGGTSYESASAFSKRIERIKHAALLRRIESE